MLMTEEQARTKWCPHAHPGADSHKCIASECMGWRWGETTRTGHVKWTIEHGHGDNPDPVFELHAMTRPDGVKWELVDSVPTRVSHGIQQRRDTFIAPALGYCGAFGNPGC